MPQSAILSIILIFSAAIALKVYQDRGEINAPHAEVSIGISLFQDITTVVLLNFLPNNFNFTRNTPSHFPHFSN